MPDLTIWGVGTSRTIRPHWAMQELGLPYKTMPIGPRTGSYADAACPPNPIATAATALSINERIIGISIPEHRQELEFPGVFLLPPVALK